MPSYMQVGWANKGARCGTICGMAGETHGCGLATAGTSTSIRDHGAGRAAGLPGLIPGLKTE